MDSWSGLPRNICTIGTNEHSENFANLEKSISSWETRRDLNVYSAKIKSGRLFPFKKGLYRLKQSPHFWFAQFSKVMIA